MASPAPSYAVLPPGVSAEDFTAALTEFAGILGADHVSADPLELAPYGKLMESGADDAHRPSAVLRATTVPQIQQLVGVCNKYRIPVWTISTGRNFGYGSAAPATRGQVILDLKLMNRIIEVDPVLCTALVEPGVTYQQLKDYLEENNIPLWLSCPAPSATTITALPRFNKRCRRFSSRPRGPSSTKGTSGIST